ncbi:hypothetical protein LI014_06030 [Clostridium perfringens]|uniref:hypothetical protein n=1 Tax=Clostridium perfringens TaxID=1502 RepID=UPI0022466BC8|nr:hypothetical protein [Clostridium perfringens]MCX0396930.1 hypothetical protein [Clostridium perfringens]
MKKIFLEKLPRNKDKINWKGSIGCKVPFIYDDIKGEIEIIDYLCCKSKLKIKYNNKSTEMTIGNFQRVNLGRLIGKIVKGFKFEINQNIKDNKRDLTIIDKEYRKKLIKKSFENQKYYKYHCNKCGNEDWIREGNLINSRGCPVCSKHKAKLGINTIWDTDRWMCNLGVSEEDAKKYSRGSSRKITVKCPNCGREKKIVINSIYLYQSIGCSCGDGKSYPEKFVMNFLEQLNVSFEVEYSPDWIDNKRYDFHIEDINCIIETHGKQHYSIKTNFKSCGGRNFNQEQQNDKIKRETALKNGIKHYIELDCRESNMDYIKNSILNSELNDLFDLSNINWTGCAEFANKNIVKEVCDYWNNKREDETTSDIGKIFKIDRSVIIDYLKRGTRLGWCDYNAKEEMKKRGFRSGKNSAKRVEVFKNNQSLGIFESCIGLERQSEELFGVRLIMSSISQVCNGHRKQYKGFVFRYL